MSKMPTLLKSIIWLTIGILLISMIIFSVNRIWFDTTVPIDSEKWGHFGDFIGGFIGSIWALIGVILFYIALKEQREDFKINRKTLESQVAALNHQVEEFQHQRLEQIETRKVFLLQQQTLELQQFESTYFNLINLHHTIVSTIDLRKNRKKKSDGFDKSISWTETGRDCFESFYNGIKNKYKRQKSIKDNVKKAAIAFDRYYDKHHSDLDSYLRNIHYILRFIFNSQKKFDVTYYLKLFISQLSTFEIMILFYSGFSQHAKSSKKLYVEADLFRNLQEKLLFDPDDLKFYSSVKSL